MPRVAKLPDYFKTTDFKSLFKTHGMKKGGVRVLAFKLIQEGKSLKEVSELILVPHATIRSWMDIVEKKGTEGLIDQEGKNLRIKDKIKNPKHPKKIFVAEPTEKSPWKTYNHKPESEGVFAVLSKIKKVWKREKHKQ